VTWQGRVQFANLVLADNRLFRMLPIIRANKQAQLRNEVPDMPFDHVSSKMDVVELFGVGNDGGGMNVTKINTAPDLTEMPSAQSLRTLTDNAAALGTERPEHREGWRCCPTVLDGGHIGDLPMRSWRVRIYFLLHNTVVKSIMAFIILCNAVQVIYECDVTQTCKYGSGDAKVEACSEVDGWLNVMNLVYLTAYTIELALRLFVDRMRFFSDKWDVGDFMIVAVGLSSHFFGSQLPSPGIFRLFRLVRLAKALHFLKLKGELHLMVNGFVTAARAIFLGTGIIAAAVILWAVAAVELLSELNRSEDILAAYERLGCERCERAWSSVWQASLSILSTTLMGDSWGTFALPMIERHPATIVVFVGTGFSIVLGLTNLILAVIVDRALQQQCLEDERDLALKRETALDAARLRFVEMCKTIDTDNSGTLSLEELLAAFDNVSEFRDGLMLMGVFQKHEIEILFNMIDKDAKDAVSYEEFASQLATIKNQDLHALSAFIKHSLMDMMFEMADIKTALTQALPLHGQDGTPRSSRRRKHSIFSGDNGERSEEGGAATPRSRGWARLQSGDTQYVSGSFENNLPLSSPQRYEGGYSSFDGRSAYGSFRRKETADGGSFTRKGTDNGTGRAVDELRKLAESCRQQLELQVHQSRKQEQWVEKSLLKLDGMLHGLAVEVPLEPCRAVSPGPSAALVRLPEGAIQENSDRALSSPTSESASILGGPRHCAADASPRSPQVLAGQMRPRSLAGVSQQLEEDTRASMRALEEQVAKLLSQLSSPTAAESGCAGAEAKWRPSTSTCMPSSTHDVGSSLCTTVSSVVAKKGSAERRVSMPL